MVNINLKIQKKDLCLLSAIMVFLIGVSFVIAKWDTTKTMFHSGDDVKITIDGVGYSLQEAINNGGFGSYLGECKWFVVGKKCTLDFGDSLKSGIVQEFSDCNTGGRSTMNADRSPYILCPDEYPFMKGIALMDQDGSGNVDEGDYSAYCCK